MLIRRPGLTAPARPATPRRVRLRSRFLAGLLLVLIAGIALSPAAPVNADPLSDALAGQRALQAQIAAQKDKVAQLATLQSSLTGQIASTRTALSSVNADLAAVRDNVTALAARVDEAQLRYNDLVAQVQSLDAQLAQVRAEEALKAEQLVARKAQLAERLRNAYDLDRTSLLELLLSSGSFTDLVSEAGYYLDVGAQDKALADQVALDQQVLAELHQTVVSTRADTEELRIETDAQKKDLDVQLAGLKDSQDQLQKLEAETQRLLAVQTDSYVKLTKSKAEAQSVLDAAAAAEKQLKDKIDELVNQQYAQGRIPSAYNGTLGWPLAGTVTQPFGCTGFAWEPPVGTCRHFHRGIDIADDMYTPVHAAGAGVVVFAGANPYDPVPKAWIVIIAHSSNLKTWYAHLDNGPHPIPVHAGDVVNAGDVIGYVGMTGRTTGPHLHWAVDFNGDWADPRLFL